MAVFDIIGLIILLVLAVRGLAKGLVKELLGKASYLIGLLAALMFAGLLAEYLNRWIQFGHWNNVIAFILLFAAGFGLTRAFSVSFEEAITQLRLKPVDSLLGFFLGALEGAIVISFIVFLLKLQTFLEVQQLLDESTISRILEPIAPFSISLVTGSI